MAGRRERGLSRGGASNSSAKRLATQIETAPIQSRVAGDRSLLPARSYFLPWWRHSFRGAADQLAAETIKNRLDGKPLCFATGTNEVQVWYRAATWCLVRKVVHSDRRMGRRHFVRCSHRFSVTHRKPHRFVGDVLRGRLTGPCEEARGETTADWRASHSRA